jgi:N6-adenosine-specific RNA methylase IME4
MNRPPIERSRRDRTSRLALLLANAPPGLRGPLLMSVISFRPNATLESSFVIGDYRAAFAEYWETKFNSAVPVTALRSALDPPISVRTVLEFNKFALTNDATDVESYLETMTQHLADRLRACGRSSQRTLFPTNNCHVPAKSPRPAGGAIIGDLHQLIADGRKFSTVYADPPWQYDNDASRAAAANHYSTMPLDEICAEPVSKIAAENAHLHLWTTNGFLREVFEVINAWGFQYKSCLVWTKPEIGMGNYWRVSHEYLLLGVRGSLTFRDRTLPSWIHADRTIHSRKPAIVRSLIERVSPGPYLELYGREELPDSDWTVYGNEIERRHF